MFPIPSPTARQKQMGGQRHETVASRSRIVTVDKVAHQGTIRGIGSLPVKKNALLKC